MPSDDGDGTARAVPIHKFHSDGLFGLGIVVSETTGKDEIRGVDNKLLQHRFSTVKCCGGRGRGRGSLCCRHAGAACSSGGGCCGRGDGSCCRGCNRPDGNADGEIELTEQPDKSPLWGDGGDVVQHSPGVQLVDVNVINPTA